MHTEHLFAVVLAGGIEKPFWPADENDPASPLSASGRVSMIQTVVDRVAGVIPAQRILPVVDGVPPLDVCVAALGIPRENFLVEPLSRGTAACIGLAAHAALKKDPSAIMLVMPSDHVITKKAEFLGLVKAGAVLAETERAPIALGIAPAAPETRFGYMEAGAPGPEALGRQARHVEMFDEKPDQKTAESYVNSGGFFWNSGIFIWRADVILNLIREHLPELYQGLEKISPHLSTPSLTDAMIGVYTDLPDISIDYGVMEKTANVLVLPADIGWSDIGCWAAASTGWPRIGPNSVNGRALLIDSSGTIIHSPEKTTVLIGVNDLIIVDGPEALLICPKDRESDIRKALEKFRRGDEEEKP